MRVSNRTRKTELQNRTAAPFHVLSRLLVAKESLLSRRSNIAVAELVHLPPHEYLPVMDAVIWALMAIHGSMAR